MLQSLHQLIQVWSQSISLLCNFVFHSLIRSWIWLVEHRHKFLRANLPRNPNWKRAELGGVHLNTLLDNIRGEIAGLMRWYPNEDEEEEEDGSPTPRATSSSKKEKSGQWLLERMPWEPYVEENAVIGAMENPPCDAIDASYRHIMHSCFGHQSWALHTLVVAMVAYQIAYIQIVHTHTLTHIQLQIIPRLLYYGYHNIR